MPKINDPELHLQELVLDLFSDKSQLDYIYYGDLRHQKNKNIMPEVLYSSLIKRGYSKTLARKALDKLIKTANHLNQGLYKANQDVYSLLKYGVKVQENAGESDKNVWLIDWENYRQNEFAIAEEVTIGNRRPDLVIYINGIAIAVIELKKSIISVSNGIRQNLSNQSGRFNRPFFSTIQYVMAGNNSEGLRYGTIDTLEKYYLEWKNDPIDTDAQPQDITSSKIFEHCKNLQDKLLWQVYSMFHKERLLDLIHNFIIFDNGIKKVCRHNQFFGIKKAQIKYDRNQGGIIWHTQGSGKTLTMVWLSKWILAHNSNARILIVTDRDELDDQVKKVYTDVNEKVYRTSSCDNLVSTLNKSDKRLICTLIHKFGVRSKNENQGKRSVEQFIKELKEALPNNFVAKGDFVIFVDECHRTQSGVLHTAMKEILPHAIFIGFTGTPLLVKNKKTSIETFAPGYIHTYKFDAAVEDKVVLDLRYEAREVEQVIHSQDKIDEFFEKKTKGLNDSAKAKLKSKWAKMQAIFSSRNRLNVIVQDIISDFDLKPRLEEKGNAILVANDIYSACRYYELFQSNDFKKCAIVTSFTPNVGNLRTEVEGDEEFVKYETYVKMLAGQSVDDFEAEAKRKFIEEPANMKLLIVVDKLLTGFDAPPCTYLYIDKSMQDHSLFQAICRVNRLDGEDKDFGYIVDYKQLFGKLSGALEKYTSGAFEGYAPEDIEGLIKDRVTEGRKYLDSTLEELDDLCGGVPLPKEEINYIHYFCGENGVGGIDDESCSRSREKLYRLVSRLLRAYAEIKADMDDAGYTKQEQEDIDKQVVFYTALKDTIGRASGDFLDLKSYEQDMRRLIDSYISAKDSEKLGDLDDFTLLDFVQNMGEKLGGQGSDAAAEAIENNIRKNIVEKLAINPKYYEKLSAILDELIKARKQDSIAYEKMLKSYIELVKNTENPENNAHYPESIRHSGALRAFFDNCGEDEELAIKIDKTVRQSKEADFRTSLFKERKIKRALLAFLDENEVERIYVIVLEQKEY